MGWEHIWLSLAIVLAFAGLIAAKKLLSARKAIARLEAEPETVAGLDKALQHALTRDLRGVYTVKTHGLLRELVDRYDLHLAKNPNLTPIPFGERANDWDLWLLFSFLPPRDQAIRIVSQSANPEIRQMAIAMFEGSTETGDERLVGMAASMLNGHFEADFKFFLRALARPEKIGTRELVMRIGGTDHGGRALHRQALYSNSSPSGNLVLIAWHVELRGLARKDVHQIALKILAHIRVQRAAKDLAELLGAVYHSSGWSMLVEGFASLVKKTQSDDWDQIMKTLEDWSQQSRAIKEFWLELRRTLGLPESELLPPPQASGETA